MFEMMLKSMGYEPEEFKKNIASTIHMINSFDARLKAIELKIDAMYDKFLEGDN